MATKTSCRSIQVFQIFLLLSASSTQLSRALRLPSNHLRSRGSIQWPGWVSNLPVAGPDWSTKLSGGAAVRDLANPSPPHSLPLKRDGQFSLFRQYSAGAPVETLGHGVDRYSSSEFDPWDDLDVIVLIGRKTSRKKRMKSKKKILIRKPIYSSKQGRVRSAYVRQIQTTRTTTTTEVPMSLHKLAGPPYRQGISPNATFLVFEEEFIPNIQSLPGYAASSANLKTTIAKGVNLAKNVFAAKTSSPRKNFASHSGAKEARSIDIAGKSGRRKFSDNPAYTFSLEDAVARNYPSRGKKSFNSSFSRRRSQIIDDQNRGRSAADFSATVGYPDNNWQRINRKVIL